MHKSIPSSYHQLEDDEVEPRGIKRVKTIKIFNLDFLMYLLKKKTLNPHRDNVLS